MSEYVKNSLLLLYDSIVILSIVYFKDYKHWILF